MEESGERAQNKDPTKKVKKGKKKDGKKQVLKLNQVFNNLYLNQVMSAFRILVK